MISLPRVVLLVLTQSLSSPAVATGAGAAGGLGNVTQQLLATNGHDRGYSMDLENTLRIYATSDGASPTALRLVSPVWATPGALPARVIELEGHFAAFLAEIESMLASRGLWSSGVPTLVKSQGRLRRLQILLESFEFDARLDRVYLWAASSDEDAVLAAMAVSNAAGDAPGDTQIVVLDAAGARSVVLRHLDDASPTIIVGATLVGALDALGRGPLVGYVGPRADVICGRRASAVAVLFKGGHASYGDVVFEPADRVGRWGVVAPARRMTYADTSRVDAVTLRVDRDLFFPIWLASDVPKGGATAPRDGAASVLCDPVVFLATDH